MLLDAGDGSRRGLSRRVGAALFHQVIAILAEAAGMAEEAILTERWMSGRHGSCGRQSTVNYQDITK